MRVKPDRTLALCGPRRDSCLLQALSSLRCQRVAAADVRQSRSPLPRTQALSMSSTRTSVSRLRGTTSRTTAWITVRCTCLRMVQTVLPRCSLMARVVSFRPGHGITTNYWVDVAFEANVSTKQATLFGHDRVSGHTVLSRQSIRTRRQVQVRCGRGQVTGVRFYKGLG